VFKIVGHCSRLEPDDKTLLHFLFRESSNVTLTAVGGGFSGCLVFKSEGYDLLGLKLAPICRNWGQQRRGTTNFVFILILKAAS
jgi:hypothetical protein